MEKQKKVLIQVDNIRIVEYDAFNVKMERYETTLNKRTGEETSKWTFKGYFNTILTALESILKNELLIDKKTVSDLENYLKQVRESNDKVIEIITSL